MKKLFTKKDIRQMIKNGLPTLSPKITCNEDVESMAFVFATLRLKIIAAAYNGGNFFICPKLHSIYEEVSLQVRGAIVLFSSAFGSNSLYAFTSTYPSVLIGTKVMPVDIIHNEREFRETYIDVMESDFNRKARRLMK